MWETPYPSLKIFRIQRHKLMLFRYLRRQILWNFIRLGRTGQGCWATPSCLFGESGGDHQAAVTPVVWNILKYHRQDLFPGFYSILCIYHVFDSRVCMCANMYVLQAAKAKSRETHQYQEKAAVSSWRCRRCDLVSNPCRAQLKVQSMLWDAEVAGSSNI